MEIDIMAKETLSDAELEEFLKEDAQNPLYIAGKYQLCVDEIRKRGATKTSLNRLMQQWHIYTQDYPIPHLPVSVCLESFNQAVKEDLAKDAKPALTKERGRIAYCGVLPKLSNRESIRDFIACVVHGMALGIIPGPEGTRLLYGAQVAQAALPPKRKWRKDPAKSKPKDAPKCTQTAPKQPSNSAEPVPDQPLTQ